jgi:hypothetical protein
MDVQDNRSFGENAANDLPLFSGLILGGKYIVGAGGGELR